MGVMHTNAGDLPEGLALPLASGEAWWYWTGGRPALDFVNTLRERWRRRVETLVTPADLGTWLVRARLTSQPVNVSRALLREARDLREAIDAGVRAVIAGEAVPAGAVAGIDRWLPQAAVRPRLRVGAGGAPVLDDEPVADPARAALAAIAFDAAAMLGRPEERARIRVCASATCSGRFYDRSPAAQRRWCSMRTCGNAAKARRYRERARALADNQLQPHPDPRTARLST